MLSGGGGGGGGGGMGPMMRGSAAGLGLGIKSGLGEEGTGGYNPREKVFCESCNRMADGCMVCHEIVRGRWSMCQVCICSA